MDYISTRGLSPKRSFSEILLEGLAPDGGLYVPEYYPQLDLESLRGLSFQDLAAHICNLYAPEIGLKTWNKLTSEAYTAARFGSADIVPLRWLESNFGLLGLSEGPTLAFKDIALQLLPLVMQYVLGKGGELNILGGTSGDTGSAAEHGIADREGLRCFMLSPAGRMSAFQQQQMYTLDYPNIFNLVVNGTFDDCQDTVKEVFKDAKFKARYKLGAVNSINWARIVFQIVYWVWAYLRATDEVGAQLVRFVVPSGNFGNALSAYAATRMGVPAVIVVATNENDVLDVFFSRGIAEYRYQRLEKSKPTSSPSMDIQEASNFERYVFELVGRNAGQLRELWRQYKASGHFVLGPEYVDAISESRITSGVAYQRDVLKTIRLIEKCEVIIDPHTAVGVAVALQRRNLGVPTIIAETAKPAKFADTIRLALGREPPVPAGFEKLAELPQKTHRIDPDPEAVKRFIADRVAA